MALRLFRGSFYEKQNGIKIYTGRFLSPFRGCLYEKRDVIMNGTGQFLSLLHGKNQLGQYLTT